MRRAVTDARRARVAQRRLRRQRRRPVLLASHGDRRAHSAHEILNLRYSVGEDLRNLTPETPFPSGPRDIAAVLIASDFYQPLDLWRARLTPLAAKCRDGALLQVADPVEEGYPFDGRVRFFRPGEQRERLIGRAQSIREGYLERFAKRRQDMTDLAAELGWRFVSHATSEEPRTPLGQLAYGFTASGAAA